MHLNDIDTEHYTVNKNGERVTVDIDNKAERHQAVNDGVHLHFAAQAGKVCDWCLKVQGQ